MTLILSLFLSIAATAEPSAVMPDASAYVSLQAAIDANPGKVIYLPQQTFIIREPLRLDSNASLTGHGTIVQENTGAAMVFVEGAEHVRIRDVTFTRPEDARECGASAIDIRSSRDVVLENIRVLDNHSQQPVINMEDCDNCRVTGSEVRNYKRIAVDDRTAPGESLYGYAFRCIDGSGIVVRNSRNIQLLHNQITEDKLLPTREIKEQHLLGTLTEGRYPNNPGALGKNAVHDGYVSNWHQGSAIVVTGPEITRDILISGNYIGNCAQGIDLHCDYTRCTDNTVVCGMIGIKMTHGSKHVIVSDNLLTRIDLWGILYNPGAASHGPVPASGDTPAKPDNSDGGSIIANNIITDYGYGHEYWNWGGASADQSGSYAIALLKGQIPENPPLGDVVLTGNLVYGGRNGDALRYRYALYIEDWNRRDEPGSNAPRQPHLYGNLFHPGSGGISNAEVPGDKNL